MSRTFTLSGWSVLALVVLAACGGAAIGDAAAQFGNNFASAFRATDTAEPVEPTAVTYRGVTDSNVEGLATLEPVNF
jgi:multidrug efflux pump subunit AcrA (membrane-fusion protein)